ncbi:MAG: double-strand break repair protein AddB, partial [Rhodospirillales bacterium]|nr:double-strand break repair protein AddB [Rhodospirillales bacterium]
MNLATIPPDAPFLDLLAARWLAETPAEAVPRGIILLPTRRAARALAEAFLRAGGGRPMLLPRITAIGALDEAPLALAGALELAPAIAPLPRLAALARLILALPPSQGGAGPEAAGGGGAARAWKLAEALAGLMDEAEQQELDLPAALRGATGGEHAAHWQITLDFLAIVTRAWPAHLAEQGLLNPVARRVRLLHAQAAAWEEEAPEGRVWVAGLTGAIPAVARLLRAVARLERGLVVLPGLDRAMDEAAWLKLEASHPQAGLRALLAGMGAARAEVAEWRAPGPRVALLGRALLPAAALKTWRDAGPDAARIDELRHLAPGDPQHEAVAIALILRDALERPGAR